MSSASDESFAWVTLAVDTRHKLHVMYTEGVSAEMRAQLDRVFDDHTEVNVLDSGDAENLALINRPDLGVTFTKLHCWLLTQYSKCVFLDADTFVVQNCDELFERPEFSAAPDTYRNLLGFALSYGSFDGGDQGLLNSGWRESDASHRLPFIYNVTTAAIYGYAAALKRFASKVKIIHFLGKQKPWMIHYGDSVGGLAFISDYHQQWFQFYTNAVQQNLPPSLAILSCGLHGWRESDASHRLPFIYNVTTAAIYGYAAALKRFASKVKIIHFLGKQKPWMIHYGDSVGGLAFISDYHKQWFQFYTNAVQQNLPPSLASQLVDSSAGRAVVGGYEAWEAGLPDYLGADAFANIQKVIEKSLKGE
uniref:glycogenin glucosyltransferase n=1 Tax=Globodera pallida TaxID=36090 RepID=A0A183BVU8_GLOPA